MQFFFSIYFLMSLALGFNLYGGDIIDIHSKVTEDLILLAQERKLQQKPFLYVTNFIASSIASGRSDVVLPIGDFLKLQKNSQNVTSFLNARQRGCSKGAGRDASKIAILGSGDVLEAYYSRSEDSIKFIGLGSMNDIHAHDSTVNSVLRYTGYNGSITNLEKRSLARRIASDLEASGDCRAVLNWYDKSYMLGSRVLAPFDCASYLDKELLRLPVNLRRPESCTYVENTFDELAQKGHLGAMRAIAKRCERTGDFMKASEWYRKALLEKGHKASIQDMVRCADNLWDKEKFDYKNLSIIPYIQKLYALAAYKFGHEGAVNKLADLMCMIDGELGDAAEPNEVIKSLSDTLSEYFFANDHYKNNGTSAVFSCYFETSAIDKQLFHCPDQVAGNTYLRLALLLGLANSELGDVFFDKEHNHRLKLKYLNAAACLGNLPSMVLLRSLSKDGNDKKHYSDMILALKQNIFSESLMRDSLVYLAPLNGWMHGDLLSDACKEASMDEEEIVRLAEDSFFQPSVDFRMSDLNIAGCEGDSRKQLSYDVIHTEGICPFPPRITDGVMQLRFEAHECEIAGDFMKALACYIKAFENGDKASIKNIVRCANELWDDLDDNLSPLIISYVKGLYELAAYEFHDEEALNKLADLVAIVDQKIDGCDELVAKEFADILNSFSYPLDSHDPYYLEKSILNAHLVYSPDKATANTYLRLGLLAGLTEDNNSEKVYLERSAGLGNLPAMVRLRSLSESAEDQKRYSYMISALKQNSVSTSLIRNSLLYLAYLDQGAHAELLESACREVSIDHDEMLKLAETTSPFGVGVEAHGLELSLVDDSSEFQKDCKREREEDEVCGEIAHKRMRFNGEFESE